MYVCLCNGISDKTIDEKLSEKTEAIDIKKIKDIYAECSGGKSDQCGKCLTQFKNAVKNRNNEISVNTASADIKLIQVVNL